MEKAKLTSKISIIISTKGKKSPILFSLRGFLNQTAKSHEIVLVGESQDLEVIKKSLFRRERRQIKFIEFSGDKNESRNTGFYHSSGEYVLYADQDMIPQPDLIESCLKQLEENDALIIPERGSDGNKFLEKIHKLEKEIVMNDPDALTPRLFKKLLFKNEKPFDKKFGVLDEWGFQLKLKTKNPKIGTINSYFTELENLSLLERIKKSYKKGLWIKNLIKEDKRESLRRINPINRGIKVYLRKLHYFKSKPVLFTALLFVKSIDLVSFYTGYLINLNKTLINKGKI